MPLFEGIWVLKTTFTYFDASIIFYKFLGDKKFMALTENLQNLEIVSQKKETDSFQYVQFNVNLTSILIIQLLSN